MLQRGSLGDTGLFLLLRVKKGIKSEPRSCLKQKSDVVDKQSPELQWLSTVFQMTSVCCC